MTSQGRFRSPTEICYDAGQIDLDFIEEIRIVVVLVIRRWLHRLKRWWGTIPATGGQAQRRMRAAD